MIKEINDRELLKMLIEDQADLIDVREVEEILREGDIQGAKHWPLSSFGLRQEELSKTKPTIFYCRSGMRSMKAAEIAEHWTNQPIYSLQGGIISHQNLQKINVPQEE